MRNFNRRRKFVSVGVLCAAIACATTYAQVQAQRPGSSTQNVSVAQGVSATVYAKWLDEDARWIITDQERDDFSRLTTYQQRDHFIEAFWERRNPNLGSAENVFKEEHYRRLAYTNEHFAAAIPGWKTARGHTYIVYGRPDYIESHPTLSPPTEVWSYKGVAGKGQDLVLRFVDPCRCGLYGLAEQSIR